MSHLSPLRILFESKPVCCEISAGDDRGSQDVLRCKPSQRKARHLDAVQVRDEFLAIDSSSGLKAFLERTGCFYGSSFPLDELRSWQELIRSLLTTPPPQWAATIESREKRLVETALTYRNLSVHLPMDEKGGVPYVQASTALEAIMASILMDHLNGVRYAICTRPDCDKLYKMNNQRMRLFCSQYCGHLVSLRKTRAVMQDPKDEKEKNSQGGKGSSSGSSDRS